MSSPTEQRMGRWEVGENEIKSQWQRWEQHLERIHGHPWLPAARAAQGHPPADLICQRFVLISGCQINTPSWRGGSLLVQQVKDLLSLQQLGLLLWLWFSPWLGNFYMP